MKMLDGYVMEAVEQSLMDIDGVDGWIERWLDESRLIEWEGRRGRKIFGGKMMKIDGGHWIVMDIEAGLLWQTAGREFSPQKIAGIWVCFFYMSPQFSFLQYFSFHFISSSRKEFAELMEKYGSSGSTGSTRNSPIQHSEAHVSLYNFLSALLWTLWTFFFQISHKTL